METAADGRSSAALRQSHVKTGVAQVGVVAVAQLFVLPAAAGGLGGSIRGPSALLRLRGPSGEHLRVDRQRRFREICVTQGVLGGYTLTRIVRQESASEGIHY